MRLERVLTFSVTLLAVLGSPEGNSGIRAVNLCCPAAMPAVFQGKGYVCVSPAAPVALREIGGLSGMPGPGGASSKDTVTVFGTWLLFLRTTATV